MDTEKLLQKIKMIAPDQDYTARSRMCILAEPRVEQEAPAGRVFGVRQVIFGIFNSGSAIVLTAALLLLVAGGFSFLKFFAPATTAFLDPAGLRAEAQAIDIQVQLADIVYREPIVNPANLANQTTTPAMPPKPSAKAPGVIQQARNEAEQLGLVPPATSTPKISIDEALDKLSQ